MNTKIAIPIILLAITAFFFERSGNELFSENSGLTFNTASLISWPLKSDTSDMSISDYKKEIEKLKEEVKRLKENKFKFHFDSDSFKEHMKDISIELDKFKCKDFHFEFDFNSEEFKESMKELRENLKNKKFVWKDCDFDMEEFNEGMKELKEELKDMHFNFEFDSESFEKEMEELSENLVDFDIDMGDFETEMENLKVKMKKLESFMEDMKAEMEYDGLIEDAEEDFDLVLNEDEMKVNGETVLDELHQKYLDLYEEHFGHKPDHSFKIHSH